MGQEESSLIDDNVEPLTLKARDLTSLASYIKSDRCSNIVVLTGAGISTSAGIPDFRSPETGLYANLARLNLPYPEAVFDINYFRQKPEPFYTLAHEMYPGKYRPTITHSFIYLLHKKGLLRMHFTQNIDCLDREAGVPGHSVVEAHGSFATQRCIGCQTPYPEKEMKEHVTQKKIPRCIQDDCNELVKPDIVFFGEALPKVFFDEMYLVSQADLVIVMGTSLTVQPFALLPSKARDGVPRLLVNLEQVGGLGSRPDDVLLLGDCDSGIKKLAEALGWLEELEELWAETGKKFGVDAAEPESKGGAEKTADEKLQDEVDKLTKEVDETLKLNKDYDERTRDDLKTKIETDVSQGQNGNISAPLTSDKSSEHKEGLSHVFGHFAEKPSL